MITMAVGHIVFFTLLISQTCRKFFSPKAILIEAWGIAPGQLAVVTKSIGKTALQELLW
ncbi:MAG: hypothetical protein ACK6AT_04395 [Planctomycetota bacterium]